MNIKIITIVCSCLLVATSVFAQKKQRKERPSPISGYSTERVGIDFYDGSFLLGELISDDNRTVEILAFGDDKITVEHGLIKSMRKESDGISFTRNGRFNYDKGYFVNICPFGLGVSFDGNGSYTPQIIVGYHLDKRLALGLGTGFETHSDEISWNWFNYAVIPTYAYAQYHLIVNGPRLYAYGKLGYASTVNRNFFWSNDDIRTNVYSQFGFGIAFPSRWAGRLSLEYGRTFMGVKGTINSWDWSGNRVIQEFTQVFSRNTLKIGIAFRQ